MSTNIKIGNIILDTPHVACKAANRGHVPTLLLSLGLVGCNKLLSLLV